MSCDRTKCEACRPRRDHDIPYRAMDYNVPEQLETQARRLAATSGLSLAQARKLLTDVPVVPFVRFHTGRGSGQTSMADAWAELHRAWGELVKEVGKSLEPLVKLAADGLAPPANAMDRALQARKNRNTGPAHPSAQNARRPRSHK